MINIKEKPQKVEKAYLIGICKKNECKVNAQSLLDELGKLTNTLKISQVGKKLVIIKKSNTKFLIGKGKAFEIANEIKSSGADVIVFDESFTAAQQKNWEKLTKVLVIDRCEVILDIFAKRAQTKEAKLQIKLARTKYNLPRLTHAWTHLSRQQGGTNLRGEGEKQIEVDRRLVKKKIKHLENELSKVKKRRKTQRKQREKVPIPNVAIVGYTNAGKSSLINRLTKAKTLTDDSVFATLDPTTKKIELANNQELLLTDTVGFMRKLPHSLIDAFKSTLEEVCLANFLINVIDITNPEAQEHMETTMEVLQDLGADTKQIITVFNKIDKLQNKSKKTALFSLCTEPLAISVYSGEGIEKLRQRLSDIIGQNLKNKEYRIHISHYDIVAQLHQEAQIINKEYDRDYLIINAKVPQKLANKISKYEND